MSKFAIIGDSTCDLTPELRKEHDIDYARMRVSWTSKDKKEHEVWASLDWQEGITHKEYFDMLAGGTRIFTSQVSEQEFDEVFGRHLKAGEDVLYISCSSALSASVQLAIRLVSKYEKQYPGRKVVIVDPLNSCMGQGMMLLKADEMRKAGKFTFFDFLYYLRIKFEESAAGDRELITHVYERHNHILIDENHKFKGVIDWGGVAIVCEYAEFPYLLSDGEDELGRDIGLKILEYYGDIDLDKTIEYCNIHRMEYPITELVYGIENNINEKIEFGKKIILKKCESDEDIKKIMK